MAQQARKCKGLQKSQNDCELGLLYVVQPGGHSSMMLKLSVALSVLCTVIVLCCATFVVHTEYARYSEVLELKHRCRCAAGQKSLQPSTSLFSEARADMSGEPVDELVAFRSSKTAGNEPLEEKGLQEIAQPRQPVIAIAKEKEIGQPIERVIPTHGLLQRMKRDANPKTKRRRRRRSTGKRRHKRNKPFGMHLQVAAARARRNNPNPASGQSSELKTKHGVFTYSTRGLQYQFQKRSDGIYRDWVRATGSNSSGSTEISLDNDTGKVKILKDGLYLIYAQVTFFNAQSRSTCSIYVNDAKFIQCIQSVSYVDSSKNANDNSRLKSCYMAAARFLKKNDLVYLKQEDNNKVFFREENTYFGFVKLR